MVHEGALPILTPCAKGKTSLNRPMKMPYFTKHLHTSLMLALMLWAALPPHSAYGAANTLPHCNDIKLVQNLIEQGEKAMLHQNFTKAITCFDQGLEQIGTSYYSDNLTDDTDLKLMVAAEFQKEKDFEKAARLKHRMLLIRLELFKQKYMCE